MGGLVAALSAAAVLDVIIGFSSNADSVQVTCLVVGAILVVAIVICCIAIREQDERSRREREWDRMHRR